MKISKRKLEEFDSLTIPEPNSGCLIFLGQLNFRDSKRSCRQCDRDRHWRVYRPTTSRRRRKHLTKGERAEIKARIRKKQPHSQIAKALGVSVATISNVRNGKNRYDRPANNL